MPQAPENHEVIILFVILRNSEESLLHCEIPRKLGMTSAGRE